MRSPVKAVLFDLDDTLWPIAPVIQRAEQVLHAWLARFAPQVAERFSIADLRQQRLALQATHPRFQFDLHALRRTALHQAFGQVEEDAGLIDEAMRVFDSERNRVTPFDDVLPALKRLGSRFLLGAVTNGGADLQAIGIAHLFRAVVSAHALGCAKPDRAIFEAGCGALAVAPEQAVYVGDDPFLDIEGAQRAGMRAVWINRFEKTLPAPISPDGVCATLDDLEHWLDAHCVVT